MPQLRVCYHEFYEFTNLTNLCVDKNYVKPACRQINVTKIALKGNLLVKFDKIVVNT